MKIFKNIIEDTIKHKELLKEIEEKSLAPIKSEQELVITISLDTTNL